MIRQSMPQFVLPRKGGRMRTYFLPLIVVMVSLSSCLGMPKHPSDEQVMREFVERRDTFEMLLRMFREESRVSRISYDFIWIDNMPDVGDGEIDRYLPPQRYAEYRRLFRILDLESGIIRYQNGSIGFLRSSSGFITSGSSKEILWAPAFDGQLLDADDERSLESACVPRTGCWSARRLAPDWYLIYESH